MIYDIPLPSVENPIDARFWDYAAKGELAVQVCAGCDASRFPPQPYCPACQSPEHQWHIASGRGTIWSYVVPHAPLLPAFGEQLPYVVALVELEDYSGLRMIGAITKSSEGNIQGVDGSQVNIGDSVRVIFQKMDDKTFLPRWIKIIDTI